MTQGTRTPARHSQRRSGSPRQPRREPGRASQAAPTLRLERLVHERVRLGILSALAVTDTLSFTDMKTLLATTDGNVSVHARKLEKAGYIACTKSFADRVPRRVPYLEYRRSLLPSSTPDPPAAFDWHCIPPSYVASRSNTAGIFPRRASPCANNL